MKTLLTIIAAVAIGLSLASRAAAQKVSSLAYTNALTSNALFSVSAKTTTGYGTRSIAWGQISNRFFEAYSPLWTNSLGTAFRLTETNLNNAAWRTLQASRLGDNANARRFGWTNTIKKIANGQPFRILVQGCGLTYGVGLLQYAPYAYLTNRFDCAGFFTANYPFVYTGTRSGTAAQKSGKDANWFSYYEQTSSTDDQVTLSMSYPWNVAEIDYKMHPNGGSFQVWTNISGGLYGSYANTGLSINTSNDTVTGGVCFFTNTAGAQTKPLRLVQSSATGTTNWIVNYGAWDTTPPRSYTWGLQAMSSAYMSQVVAPPVALRTVVYSNWAPDLLLFNQLETTNAAFTTNYSAWISFYTNACPNSDRVICGNYPVVFTSANIPDQNAWMRSNAVALGMSFFDGDAPFQSLTNVVAPRGLGNATAPLTDVHYSAEGIVSYDYFLSRWLALDEFGVVGVGDMRASVYDTNFNGIVNAARGWTGLTNLDNTFTGSFVSTNNVWTTIALGSNWTNTLGVNIIAFITATTVELRDETATQVTPIGAISPPGLFIPMHPGWYLTGTLIEGRAYRQ